MQSGHHEFLSDFARKYIAQGRQEGEVKGEVSALLKVLAARGFELDAGARQRILACTDLTQIDYWLRRAVTIKSLAELFEN